LRDQLGRLGGTPFKLGGLKNFLSGEVLLPVSELNRFAARGGDGIGKIAGGTKNGGKWQRAENTQHSTFNTQHSTQAEPQLIILVRDIPQLEAALKCGATKVYCEFEGPKEVSRGGDVVSYGAWLLCAKRA